MLIWDDLVQLNSLWSDSIYSIHYNKFGSSAAYLHLKLCVLGFCAATSILPHPKGQKFSLGFWLWQLEGEIWEIKMFSKSNILALNTFTFMKYAKPLWDRQKFRQKFDQWHKKQGNTELCCLLRWTNISIRLLLLYNLNNLQDLLPQSPRGTKCCIQMCSGHWEGSGPNALNRGISWRFYFSLQMWVKTKTPVQTCNLVQIRGSGRNTEKRLTGWHEAPDDVIKGAERLLIRCIKGKQATGHRWWREIKQKQEQNLQN